MRRQVWIIGATLLLAGLGWWLLHDGEPGGGPPPARAPADARHASPSVLPKAARDRALRAAPEAHLAKELNRPGGTLQEDVAIVGSLIAAFRSNYAGRGNPIGDNREIIDTLLGKNPNGIIFLQEGHPAINAKGELCDRFGTPFHFHAESGRKMEVRSAGPDGKFWTADDVFFVP